MKRVLLAFTSVIFFASLSMAEGKSETRKENDVKAQRTECKDLKGAEQVACQQAAHKKEKSE